ncbi:MAG: tetratricopeptide repeat protein [Pirellulaceae bacterium]|jgi:tetratricopeptide (TPR) repeat protein|nr:tetratricopeptide repeat protein [Pirellulaceae bacterium]
MANDGEFARIHAERAQVLIAQAKWELAAEELVEAIAAGGESADLHAYLAWCLVEMRDRDGALEAAQSAIRCQPDDAVGYLAQAGAQLAIGDLSSASTAVDQAIALDPNSALAWSIKSQVLHQQGRIHSAVVAARNAHELDPQNARIIDRYALLLIWTRRFEEAEVLMKTAFNLAPNDPYSHLVHGWYMTRRGETERAASSFQEAIRLDPLDDQTRLGMIMALKLRLPLLPHFFTSSSPVFVLGIAVFAVVLFGLVYNLEQVFSGGIYEWEVGVVLPTAGVVMACLFSNSLSAYSDLWLLGTKSGRLLLPRRSATRAIVASAMSTIGLISLALIPIMGDWKPWLPIFTGLLFWSQLYSWTSQDIRKSSEHLGAVGRLPSPSCSPLQLHMKFWETIQRRVFGTPFSPHNAGISLRRSDSSPGD